MDTLGIKLLSEVSRYTGEDVCYTYSYYRFYQKGDVLKKHTDRKSCDISATVYLGSDTSNLDYPYSWPFFVKHEKEDLEIHLNPGDIVLYRGCDLPHWRNECECLIHGQVFLHYNKNGEEPYMMVEFCWESLNVFKGVINYGTTIECIFHSFGKLILIIPDMIKKQFWENATQF